MLRTAGLWAALTLLLFVVVAAGACGEGAGPAPAVPVPVPSSGGSGAAEAAPSAPPPEGRPLCASVAGEPRRVDPEPSVIRLPVRGLRPATAPSQRGPALGGRSFGFVAWMDAAGRLALLYTFAERPTFGHHGEPRGAAPEHVLIDLAGGGAIAVDDLVVAGPRGERVAILSEGRLRVVGSDGPDIDLTDLGADPRGDDNLCLARPQVAFDETGRRVSWIPPHRRSAVIRDLRTGVECEVPTDGAMVWRAMPLAVDGWTLLREVPEDSDGDGAVTFPRQQTSCVCRWCGRFALSYGFYGWAGDAFRSVAVAPDGTRHALAQEMVPVGDAARASVDRRTSTVELLDLSGRPVLLPEGCTVSAAAPGASTALLSCGRRTRLLNPATGGSRELAVPVDLEAIAHSWLDRDDRLWAVAVARQGPRRFLSRLRMADGRLEVGPRIQGAPSGHRRWVSALTGEGVAALDLETGRAVVAVIPGVTRTSGLVATLRTGQTALLGAETGRYLVTDVPLAAGDSRGCGLLPDAVEGNLEIGPWRQVCP
ncbi:MAG: hypothetical protein ACFCGT_15815 [Sandaracinaceae bacterium]